MSRILGFDFGTTNSVVATATPDGGAELLVLDGPERADAVFRSALCFWEGERGGVEAAAGPWAIAEYLDYPEGCRFIQSFKTVAASASFDQATVFERRLRFEELGQRFLMLMAARANGALAAGADRVIVGRPVAYAGARPDEALARQRYDAMFAGLGRETHYVYEPMGAAFSYAARHS